MADEAYPTSEPGQRQLSSMSPEEKARHDAALKARQEEAGRESTGSVKRRYGLSSKDVPTYSEESFDPVERALRPKTVPETGTTQRMSTELAERYKQFHAAQPGPIKDYFAQQIKELQGNVDTSQASQFGSSLFELADTGNPSNVK